MRILTTTLIATAALAGLSMPAAAQYYGTKASLGNCLAAVADAERHDNEWRAPFSIEECSAIGAKSMDDGFEMLRKSQESDEEFDADRHRHRRR